MQLSRVPLFTLSLMALFALPTVGLAASFDCSKASSRVEKLICEDAESSALDEHLARYYQAARSALGRGGECLRTDQRTWLASVRNGCDNRDCLRRVYLERLAELDGLQPGATALQTIELPHGRQLVGILAPAEDEVAAPRSSTSTAVEIRGHIVDDIETGDGFVLRAADGNSYLLRPLMFLEPEDASLLTAAAQQAQSEYFVKGFLESAEESFDVSWCVYIYRLPPAGH